jgi:hypothetical protein
MLATSHCAPLACSHRDRIIYANLRVIPLPHTLLFVLVIALLRGLWFVLRPSRHHDTTRPILPVAGTAALPRPAM